MIADCLTLMMKKRRHLGIGHSRAGVVPSLTDSEKRHKPPTLPVLDRGGDADMGEPHSMHQLLSTCCSLIFEV